jgi:hypothetical protein
MIVSLAEPVRRLADQGFRYVQQIDLPSLALVRRIDGDMLTISAEAGMEITAPFAAV